MISLVEEWGAGFAGPGECVSGKLIICLECQIEELRSYISKLEPFAHGESGQTGLLEEVPRGTERNELEQGLGAWSRAGKTLT